LDSVDNSRCCINLARPGGLMSKVRILPKTQRAKNRVHEHGEVMILKNTNPNGGSYVESLRNTWQGEKWAGWFKKEEADIIEIEEKE